MQEYEARLAGNIYAVIMERFSSQLNRIRKIIVECGMLESVDQKKLNMHWAELIADEPSLKGSYIELRTGPIIGKCQLCRKEFELSDRTNKCPYCHCELFSIVHYPPSLIGVE